MKKMNFKFLLLLLITSIAFSCTNERDKLLGKIKERENNFRSQTVMQDKFDGQVLINLYDKFVEKFEKDSLVPEMLYKAAQVAVAIDKANEAMMYLDKIIDKFNDNENVLAEAYIYKGFIYETVYVDYVNARKYYNLFLNDFPQHHMYENIYLNVQTLGVNPDDLIQEFLKKQEEEEKANLNE